MDQNDPKDPAFIPRVAALHHAARVKDEDLRNAATAIACGLIAVAESGDSVAGLLEALDVTLNNQLIAVAEAM
jgi:hypothetical protein